MWTMRQECDVNSAAEVRHSAWVCHGATRRSCREVRDASGSIVRHPKPAIGHAQSSARSKPARHCRGSDRWLQVPHDRSLTRPTSFRGRRGAAWNHHDVRRGRTGDGGGRATAGGRVRRTVRWCGGGRAAAGGGGMAARTLQSASSWRARVSVLENSAEPPRGGERS